MNFNIYVTDTQFKFRPPAPPGAWAPPNAYSGYGAQQHQQQVTIIVVMTISASDMVQKSGLGPDFSEIV